MPSAGSGGADLTFGVDEVADRWDARSAKVQEGRRTEALAAWLPQACGFAPHWARVVADEGLVAGRMATPADLRRVPPSLQQDVVVGGGVPLVQRPTESQLAELVEQPLHRRIARRRTDEVDHAREHLLEEFKPIHLTRAGVGDRLVVASSKADLLRSLRSGGRAASLVGLTDHDYLVSSVPAGPTAAYWRVQAVALGTQALALHPRGHGDGLDRCVEAFSVVPATTVACLPEEAVEWARLLTEADADVSRVVHVLLVGPPVGEDRRAAIEEEWRAAGALERELVVRHVWSPDVHRTVWAECREGTTGLHTQPSLEVVEVLDPGVGRGQRPGGDLTVTSLGWRGTTLLRFRTGVSVGGVDTDPCPACGRTVPRVVGEVVEAAWHLTLDPASDDAWIDTRAIGALVEDLAGVDVWQVVVGHGRRAGEYRVEVAGVDGVADRLAARIAEATGVTASEVTMVDDADALAARVEAEGHVVDAR